eukprot:TRINITY_DN36_c1_g3_i3.p1 TRINITY_DN36_c1_g3~~TRINITY_DN36_c1_g3_i3.p1  ORF type:complete len:1308 (-),score=223.83 TRINITY_DN36_c1_g3_i3:438-4274(-)
MAHHASSSYHAARLPPSSHPSSSSASSFSLSPPSAAKYGTAASAPYNDLAGGALTPNRPRRTIMEPMSKSYTPNSSRSYSSGYNSTSANPGYNSSYDPGLAVGAASSFSHSTGMYPSTQPTSTSGSLLSYSASQGHSSPEAHASPTNYAMGVGNQVGNQVGNHVGNHGGNYTSVGSGAMHNSSFASQHGHGMSSYGSNQAAYGHGNPAFQANYHSYSQSSLPRQYQSSYGMTPVPSSTTQTNHLESGYGPSSTQQQYSSQDYQSQRFNSMHSQSYGPQHQPRSFDLYQSYAPSSSYATQPSGDRVADSLSNLQKSRQLLSSQSLIYGNGPQSTAATSQPHLYSSSSMGYSSSANTQTQITSNSRDDGSFLQSEAVQGNRLTRSLSLHSGYSNSGVSSATPIQSTDYSTATTPRQNRFNQGPDASSFSHHQSHNMGHEFFNSIASRSVQQESASKHTQGYTSQQLQGGHQSINSQRVDSTPADDTRIASHTSRDIPLKTVEKFENPSGNTLNNDQSLTDESQVNKFKEFEQRTIRVSSSEIYYTAQDPDEGAHQEVSYVPCPHCDRKFHPDRVEYHSKNCRIRSSPLRRSDSKRGSASLLEASQPNTDSEPLRKTASRLPTTVTDSVSSPLVRTRSFASESTTQSVMKSPPPSSSKPSTSLANAGDEDIEKSLPTKTKIPSKLPASSSSASDLTEKPSSSSKTQSSLPARIQMKCDSCHKMVWADEYDGHAKTCIANLESKLEMLKMDLKSVSLRKGGLGKKPTGNAGQESDSTSSVSRSLANEPASQSAKPTGLKIQTKPSSQDFQLSNEARALLSIQDLDVHDAIPVTPSPYPKAEVQTPHDFVPSPVPKAAWVQSEGSTPSPKVLQYSFSESPSQNRSIPSPGHIPVSPLRPSQSPIRTAQSESDGSYQVEKTQITKVAATLNGKQSSRVPSRSRLISETPIATTNTNQTSSTPSPSSNINTTVEQKQTNGLQNSTLKVVVPTKISSPNQTGVSSSSSHGSFQVNSSNTSESNPRLFSHPATAATSSAPIPSQPRRLPSYLPQPLSARGKAPSSDVSPSSQPATSPDVPTHNILESMQQQNASKTNSASPTFSPANEPRQIQTSRIPTKKFGLSIDAKPGSSLMSPRVRTTLEPSPDSAGSVSKLPMPQMRRSDEGSLVGLATSSASYSNKSSPGVQESPLSKSATPRSSASTPQGSLGLVVYFEEEAERNILGEVIINDSTTVGDLRLMIVNELQQPANFVLKKKRIPIHKTQDTKQALSFFRSSSDYIIVSHKL